MTRTFLRLGMLLCLCALPWGCGDQGTPAARPAYDARGELLADVARPPHPPNLIVVVIDALRADALPRDGAAQSGDPNARMPFLSSLAAKGVSFTNATSAAPWTLPSMTSLLTGLLPSEHGQIDVWGRWHLPDAVTSFAEVLSAGYGYETAALVNGDWYVQSGQSLLQGFGYWRPSFALKGVREDLAAWNAHRDRGRPFFLLLHTLEAHDPYGEENHPWPLPQIRLLGLERTLRAEDVDPPAVFRQAFLSLEQLQVLHGQMGPALAEVLQQYKWRGFAENPDWELAADLRQAYWRGARWVDGLLAETYGLLEEAGLLRNTLLVVTSDHGEAFGEHGGLAHGLRLYDELVRVPLVMSGPREFGGGRIVEEDVGLVDVLPTFLDWSGLVALPGVDGRSAMEAVRGEAWCRPVVSEEYLGRLNTGEDVRAYRVSVRTRRWKYIVTVDLRSGDYQEEVYDLFADPLEVDDLAKGTGRLPQGLVFDPCLCEAMEIVRERIWGEEYASEGDAVPAATDGAMLRVRRPRPQPCNPGT